MQRWAKLRCIVSKCVVYAKKADTHLGICFFALPVGLEPQVRVRGAMGALPVAAAMRLPAASGGVKGNRSVCCDR